MSKNIIEKKEKTKMPILLLLGGAMGILLLIFGSFGVGSEKNESVDQEQPAMDAEAYADRIEKEIGEICSRVRGAGEVSVAVTLKGGYRAVYATDSQNTGNGYKNNTVLIGSGSSEGAVLICYENPEISGIGIVCRGASDPSVRESILSLVSAAFDIGTNKIYVAVGQES